MDWFNGWFYLRHLESVRKSDLHLSLSFEQKEAKGTDKETKSKKEGSRRRIEGRQEVRRKERKREKKKEKKEQTKRT